MGVLDQSTWEQWVPPHLRGPLKDLLGMGEVAFEGTENLLGAIQRDPAGVNKSIGDAIVGGIQSVASDPVDAAKNAYNNAVGTFDRAINNTVDDYLGRLGVSSDNAKPEDLKKARKMRHTDLLSVFATAIPGSKSLKAGAKAVASSIPKNRNLGSQAASSYMIGQTLQSPSGYKGASGKPSEVAMPGGEKFEARPISQIEKAAKSYMQSRGMDVSGFSKYPEFSEERARLIAAAYDMMPHDPTNPIVVRAYDAMIQETMDQYEALRSSGVEFKFLKDGMDDPYAVSPALGYRDIIENGRLFVYPTDFGFGTGKAFDPSENPLLKSVGNVGDKSDAVANDAFRAVHDAFGHFGAGNPFFRRQGEERAFLEHSRMYSPEARGAMTSETRGQNSWLNSGPFGQSNRTANVNDTIFADQKSGLMPAWTGDARGMPSSAETQSLLEYMKNKEWR